METGKTGKYFKYAIGEIILVVIGILIALQINNWNENRKNRLAESEYYCRILEDFYINEKLVNQVSENLSDKILICKKVIKDLNTQPNNQYEILNTFLVAARQNVFVPSNIAFEDLTSSGNLQLLSDIQLKKRLIEFNISLRNTLELLKENRIEINKRMLDYDMTTEVGIQEFDYLKNELGQDIIDLLPRKNWTNDKNNPTFVKFQDNVVFLIAMYIRQKQHLSNLKKEMEEPFKQLSQKECK